MYFLNLISFSVAVWLIGNNRGKTFSLNINVDLSDWLFYEHTHTDEIVCLSSERKAVWVSVCVCVCRIGSVCRGGAIVVLSPVSNYWGDLARWGRQQLGYRAWPRPLWN